MFFDSTGRRICYFGPTVSNTARNSHLDDHSETNDLPMVNETRGYLEIIDRFFMQDQDRL